MNYEQKIRNPGDSIASGSEMFKVFGYTDINNPIYSFDLMNDSYFQRLKECIDNNSEIPEQFNANIIRLRDYRLGSLINDFREMCNCELHMYEDSWEEYRKEYNNSMPEDFYQFWMLYDTVLLGDIFPKFANLIDPISMKWVDPKYPKVWMTKDGTYKYRLRKSIKTSDPRFLYPKTEIIYDNYTPEYDPIANICEELTQEMIEYIPNWLMSVDHIHHELTNTEPKEGQSEADFVRATKHRIRRYFKRSKRRWKSTEKKLSRR